MTMPFQARRMLFGLYTLAALLLYVDNVSASPKVFGLDFKKEVPRNTPQTNTNRLRRRQKSVSADIDNIEIA